MSPLNVFKELANLIVTKNYWLVILSTLWKILFALFISILFGVVFGIISYNFQIFKEFIYPVITFFRSIPVASFVIFLLIWINSKYLSIYIGFIMGLPIIYENMYNGLVSIDKSILEMAKIYKVEFKKKLKYIYLTKTKPFIKSGIISASGLIFKAAIAAEVIGLQPDSIGERLYFSKLYLNMRELFAWTVTILILSMVFEKLIKMIFGGKNVKTN